VLGKNIVNSQRWKKLSRILLAVLALVVSTLACAEKTFTDLHVYSASFGTVGQFYDQATDKILEENVWVFRSDGSYTAIVNIDGEIITLTGKYGGDDVGDDFLFSIDTNNDGNYDEQIFASDDFSFIEWRRESGTLKYYLAK
jgi:hypothetical protein